MRYSPLLSEVVVRLRPFWASVAVIVALGTSAPEGSITVPVMLPEAPTPCPNTEPAASSRHTNTAASILIDFIEPPSECWGLQSTPSTVIHFFPALTASFHRGTSAGSFHKWKK